MDFTYVIVACICWIVSSISLCYGDTNSHKKLGKYAVALAILLMFVGVYFMTKGTN